MTNPLPIDINPAIQHVPITTPRAYTRQLIKVIAESHGVTIEDIFGARRYSKIMLARREAIVAVVQNRPHLSYPDVGRIFGKDHTSILHALKEAGAHVPRKPQPRRSFACLNYPAAIKTADTTQDARR